MFTNGAIKDKYNSCVYSFTNVTCWIREYQNVTKNERVPHLFSFLSDSSSLCVAWLALNSEICWLPPPECCD